MTGGVIGKARAKHVVLDHPAIDAVGLAGVDRDVLVGWLFTRACDTASARAEPCTVCARWVCTDLDVCVRALVRADCITCVFALCVGDAPAVGSVEFV